MKPSKPNSTNQPNAALLSVLDLNSFCRFIQTGLRVHSYLLISFLLFHSLFYNGVQRLHAGVAGYGDDREKGGQACAMISRQTVGSDCCF